MVEVAGQDRKINACLYRHDTPAANWILCVMCVHEYNHTPPPPPVLCGYPQTSRLISHRVDFKYFTWALGSVNCSFFTPPFPPSALVLQEVRMRFVRPLVQWKMGLEQPHETAQRGEAVQVRLAILPLLLPQPVSHEGPLQDTHRWGSQHQLFPHKSYLTGWSANLWKLISFYWSKFTWNSPVLPSSCKLFQQSKSIWSVKISL